MLEPTAASHFGYRESVRWLALSSFGGWGSVLGSVN
jgi:hypothetical protein